MFHIGMEPATLYVSECITTEVHCLFLLKLYSRQKCISINDIMLDSALFKSDIGGSNTRLGLISLITDIELSAYL
jgi:hypothetical protein